MHELTGLSEAAINHLIKLKAAADLISDLKEEAVKKSTDEIQEELKHNGVEVTPEQAMAIKKAPRDIVSPTHIIDLLLQDNNSELLLRKK